MAITRQDCVALDDADALAELRARFFLPDASSISTATRWARCRVTSPRECARSSKANGAPG
jgi:hypothetical protein